MAQDNNEYDLPTSENSGIMGTGKTLRSLRLHGVKAISWKDCKWSYEELESLEKMDATDCFCMAVRKAGEVNAWLVAESFQDLKESLPEIYKNVCAKTRPEIFGNQKTFKRKLEQINSHIISFGKEDYASDMLNQRISDSYPKNKRAISRSQLTIMRKLELDNGKRATHLFVKGDADIEKKRKNGEAQRALKHKYLSSISGSIDIELLNHASNRVNEKINEDKNLKNYIDLSFISIGTNWETRDCPNDANDRDMEKLESQLHFMKSIIDAIINCQNLLIVYSPHGYRTIECVVSPHRLRKDRQWIIYGYSSTEIDGKEVNGIYSFKLDRISDVKPASGEFIGEDNPYIKATYTRISRNQISYDVLPSEMPLQTVIIAVKGKYNNAPYGRTYTYHKIKEEKIHVTQTEINREDVISMGHAASIKDLDNWVFFKFEIYDYDRIAYRLLQYHGNVKVIAPLSLQYKMKKISEALFKLYH